METWFNSQSLTVYTEKIMGAVINWLPNLFIALLILLLGFWLSGRMARLMDKVLAARQVDMTLRGFLENLVNIALKIAVIIAAIAALGVTTTSLIALLGAAGLAIGLALQGSLSNLAGGVLILFFKPFRVGDFIIAQGKEGFVQKIMLFNTHLKTMGNELIILPNGDLANGIIQNMTAAETRRLDVKLGVAYRSDIDQVRSVVLKLANEHEKILAEPAPEVWVSGHGDSAIELSLRVWLKPFDYWEVRFYLLEATKKAFDAQGITIPFPQRDVYLMPVTENAKQQVSDQASDIVEQ